MRVGNNRCTLADKGKWERKKKTSTRQRINEDEMLVVKLVILLRTLIFSRRLKSKSSIYVHDVSTYIEKNNFQLQWYMWYTVHSSPHINSYMSLVFFPFLLVIFVLQAQLSRKSESTTSPSAKPSASSQQHPDTHS